MLAVGLKRILELFIGSMGIKSAHLGTETIYERPGGFFRGPEPGRDLPCRHFCSLPLGRSVPRGTEEEAPFYSLQNTSSRLTAVGRLPA